MEKCLPPELPGNGTWPLGYGELASGGAAELEAEDKVQIKGRVEAGVHSPVCSSGVLPVEA